MSKGVASAISLAIVSFAFSVLAEPVSSGLAVRAVNALIERNGQLECPVDGTVSSVRLCSATNGASFYVAKLSGGGFVVTSTDTEIDPIIAISPESDLVEDPRNPLWSLLVSDMAARRQTAASAGNGRGSGLLSAAASAGSAPASSAAARWARLTMSGDAAAATGPRLLSAGATRDAGSGKSKISDVRVSPLLKTKWGQDYVAGNTCFNYYTPGNSVCGCTATAGAQILRYHQFPTEPVEPKTYDCAVNGRHRELTQMGGVYAWSKMPYVPDAYTTTTQRKAIGKLTYDVGVAVGADYSKDSTDGDPYGFIALCKDWGYAHAKMYDLYNVASYTDDDSDDDYYYYGFTGVQLKSVLVPNLNARLPVGVSISGWDGAHATVADGYGYLDGQFSVHLNMGWDGTCDAWYVLPDDIVTPWYYFTDVIRLWGNIYPHGPERGGIASGRVLSASTSKPAAGIVVTARNSAGKVLRATTDAKGVYAFILPTKCDLDYWENEHDWMSCQSGFDWNGHYGVDDDDWMDDEYWDGEWEISLENSLQGFYSRWMWDSKNYHGLDFSVRIYTVKFNPNGGSGGTTSRNCNVLGTLPQPTRTGYSFDGWFTAQIGGEQVTEATEPQSNATYYAHWSAHPYTVVFDANDGEGDMEPMAFRYDEEQALSPCAFAKGGALFHGWSLSPRGLVAFEDGGSVKNLTAVSNGVVTLYAVWYGDVVAATAGKYIKAPLAVLGYDVPTDGATQYEVKAYGLPAGLQLKYNAAVKDKKGKVVKKAKVEWWIEGVPTSAVDFATKPAYLVITAGGKSETVPLYLETLAQEVEDLGELPLGTSMNSKSWLNGVGSGWSVSGLPTGLSFATKKVTKKSGSKTVTVAEAYAVYGKTTKAGLFTITAKKKKGAYYETRKFRVVVTPKKVDTARFGEDLTNITTMAYVKVDWDLMDGDGTPYLPAVSAVGGKVAKVTGLPSGLTFASSNVYSDKKKTRLKQKGQTIVGTPTKPGTYVVTFTKNVKSGKTTVAKTAQILWKVVANDAELSLGFNDAGGVIESGVVGLKYGDLMAFSATDGATVTASGLPKGIALANLGDGKYAFTGFTEKAGTHLVTVKATINGKTVTQRMALKVDGLPAWAKGAFNGYAAGQGDEGGATNGLATVTVSSAGKISGKFHEGGTNWTFSAASYTARPEASPHLGDEFICSNVVAKYAYKVKTKVGGKVKTVTKYVSRKFVLRVGAGDGYDGGVAAMEELRLVEDNSPYQDGEGTRIEAWQNLWGRAAFKALGKNIFYTSAKKQYKTFSVNGATDAGAAIGLLEAESLSLKVTPAGAVTATMSFDTGKTKKDPTTKKTEKVIYKATCQTVVIPLTAADADPFVGQAILYFAPSEANGFAEYAGVVPLPF